MQKTTMTIEDALALLRKHIGMTALIPGSDEEGRIVGATKAYNPRRRCAYPALYVKGDHTGLIYEVPVSDCRVRPVEDDISVPILEFLDNPGLACVTIPSAGF